MNIAVEKALEILSIHRLLDSYIGFRQLSLIVDREHIILYTFPFQGRLKERYVATHDGIAQIAIDSMLTPAEEKHLIAHALGHHFLHQGNYAHIDGIVQDKQEHQAEDFSAVLLIPPATLEKTRPSNKFELAHECGVPLALAERRIKIYEAQGV